MPTNIIPAQPTVLQMLDGNILHGQMAGGDPYIKELFETIINAINTYNSESITASGASFVGVKSTAFVNFTKVTNDVAAALEGIDMEFSSVITSIGLNSYPDWKYLGDGSDGAFTSFEETAVAQAGAASTITLALTANGTNNFYNGMEVFIIGGTGAGQHRTVTAYNGGTKVATITPNWTTNPDNTSVYLVRNTYLEGVKNYTDFILSVGHTIYIGDSGFLKLRANGTCTIEGNIDGSARMIGGRRGMGFDQPEHGDAGGAYRKTGVSGGSTGMGPDYNWYAGTSPNWQTSVQNQPFIISAGGGGGGGGLAQRNVGGVGGHSNGYFDSFYAGLLSVSAPNVNATTFSDAQSQYFVKYVDVIFPTFAGLKVYGRGGASRVNHGHGFFSGFAGFNGNRLPVNYFNLILDLGLPYSGIGGGGGGGACEDGGAGIEGLYGGNGGCGFSLIANQLVIVGTPIFNFSGTNGESYTTPTPVTGGAGGGGSGGSLMIAYKNLTGAIPTANVSGGLGGTASTSIFGANGGTGGNGADGFQITKVIP